MGCSSFITSIDESLIRAGFWTATKMLQPSIRLPDLAEDIGYQAMHSGSALFEASFGAFCPKASPQVRCLKLRIYLNKLRSLARVLKVPAVPLINLKLSLEMRDTALTKNHIPELLAFWCPLFAALAFEGVYAPHTCPHTLLQGGSNDFTSLHGIFAYHIKGSV